MLTMSLKAPLGLFADGYNAFQDLPRYCPAACRWWGTHEEETSIAHHLQELNKHSSFVLNCPKPIGSISL